MARPRNQLRQTAPERDTRLATISAACARAGVPDALCDVYAEGLVARLRRRVFEALSDVIGTGDDLEALAGWKGPPRLLAKAFELAGYCRDFGGVLVMVDAIPEAPEYVKKRWLRANRATYAEAVCRADKPNIVHADRPSPSQGPESTPQVEDDIMATTESLFGELPEKHGEGANGQEEEAKQPGYRQVADFWHAAYKRQYGREYPWRPQCRRMLKLTLDAIGEVEGAKRILATYLADRRGFYAGHELRKLYANLAEFTAKRGAQPGGSAGRLGSQARPGQGRL